MLQRDLRAWSIKIPSDGGEQEKAALVGERLMSIDSHLGLVVLSTCERIESYSLQDLSGPPQGLDAQGFAGASAVEHLFRVAAGLDSRLVGETQILGQIRRAADRAHARGMLPAALARLFRAALRVGARVRRESGLDRMSASYGQRAARRALRAGRRIGVLGTGALAKDLLRELRRSIDADLTVFGRDQAAARLLAGQFGARWAALSGLQQRVWHLDALITCVSCPTPILRSRDLAGAGRLLIIDMGMPQNVDQRNPFPASIEILHTDTLLEDEPQRRDRVQSAERVLARETTAQLRAWLPENRLPPPRAWRVRAGVGSRVV